MKIKTLIEQNLYDIAIQYYGTVDAVWDIIQKNQLTDGYDTFLIPETTLEVDIVHNKITQYFLKKPIATGEIYLYGIGYSIVDSDFSTFIVY